MSRQKIVAGNWKMNLTRKEARDLFLAITPSPNDKVLTLVFPPSLYISELIEQSNTIMVGVQNFAIADSGAYTGEISIPQIKSCGCTWGLIGHSERRMLFAESNEQIRLKVDAAVRNQFKFIFCCGEPLEVRESGQAFNYVKQQLKESLFHLNKYALMNGVIAYEPVWAIGTGKTASAEEAEEMHATIRTWLSEAYDPELAESVSILYGGSCNASNAAQLFSCPNVDGGLIGGASLKAATFQEIINSI